VRATAQQPQQAPDGAPIHYERHRHVQTTLYRLVQQHAASFIAHTEAITGTVWFWTGCTAAVPMARRPPSRRPRPTTTSCMRYCSP